MKEKNGSMLKRHTVMHSMHRCFTFIGLLALAAFPAVLALPLPASADDGAGAAPFKTIESGRIFLRNGSERGELNGENVLLNKNPKAYDIGHFVIQPALSAGSVIRFKVRAALPEGCTGGKLGAILFAKKGSGWVQAQNMLWNRPLTGTFSDIPFSASIKDPEQFGNGQCLVILYKMKGTEGVAVSRVEWQLGKK